MRTTRILTGYGRLWVIYKKVQLDSFSRKQVLELTGRQTVDVKVRYDKQLATCKPTDTEPEEMLEVFS